MYHDMSMPSDIPGYGLMGNNVKEKLKFCGEKVRIYPWCKIVRPESAMLDNGCKIFDYVFIDAGAGLKIGKYSTLTWHVLIEGGARTEIGDRVFIGPGSKLLTGTFTLNGYYSLYTDEKELDGCFKNMYGDIILEDDAYIGANCSIFPGSIIHEGAVVGANSFVKGELEPWTVYVGSPCRAIAKRELPTEERRQKLMEAIDWSNHL